MRLDTILDAIGNTPHVRLNRLFRDSGHEVWMKLERRTRATASRTASPGR
jgi:cysteine synthase A